MDEKLGEKLEKLNLSSEEVDRFTSAFKDDKFREMFREYVQEISEPENRRRYEEEIRQLEQERGNNAEFIRPTPFRVIRTSGAEKRKCFINVCGSDKIHKPGVKSAVSEDGRRGQHWTLPHSLHPGRTETDPKGNTFVIYDVIFHPDTLHMASKNKAFLDMVYDAAIDGVQRAFKVNLDKNNVRELKTKYKGSPQTSIIRRPIPGHDGQSLTPALPGLEGLQPQTESEESPPADSGDVQQSFQIQPQKNQEPIKPNYTVKYRSRVDLQNFRCSRDSAQSPRPTEILIIIDLPLLRSARDTSLEVKEKSLLLESKQPAYRLHLPLAYPVDEDQGEAKFNKHTGQLSVTLQVRPPDAALRRSVGPLPLVTDPQKRRDGPEERSEVEDDQGGKEAQTDGGEEGDREKGKERAQNSDEEQKSEAKEKKGQQIKRKQQEAEEGGAGTELPTWEERSQVNEEEEAGPLKDSQRRDSSVGDDPVRATGVYAPEASDVRKPSVSSETEKRDVLISNLRTSVSEEDREAEPASSLETTSKTTSSDLQEEPGKAEQDASLQQRPSIEEPRTSPDSSCPPPESGEGDVSLSARREESGRVFDADGNDDLQARQVRRMLAQDKKPPVADSLREVDADGKETLIRDHSTAAGFVFQNKLMYELD
uniref:Protein kintoun n=1 Tax=Fundulus heteroclitus TaxID=8078 RepID=A0A3Q2P2S2_FUNHE